MCGRSSLTKTEKELEDRFGATFYSEDLERYNPLPNFNVAPSHMHPVLTNADPWHFQCFRWGLIPFWAKDEKIAFKLINARSETIQSKPAFRQAFQKRRCLVPFDGFYEWKRRGKEKIPYRITCKNTEIFTIAGLWEKWTSPKGQIIHSFTLLTQEPNSTIAEIHNRMPAILLPEEEHLWISNEISDENAMKCIRPLPDEYTQIYRVSKRVNNVRENDADLIVPVSDDSSAPTLF